MNKPEKSPPWDNSMPAVEAFIAVGSNINPETHIMAALDLLRKTVEVLASSSFYRTAPLKRRDQPMFHNGVWHIRTRRTPESLKFDLLRPVEEALGRHRSADRHAARPIDLDLILYGDLIIDLPGLRLPDPDILQRPFIAVPLLELSPDVIVPGTDRPLSQCEHACNTAGLEALPEFTLRLRRKLEKP